MTLSKEPVRQDSIVTDIRDRIIHGALLPGARLPTRIELAEQFDTTVVTVQRALTRLSGDGFVTATRARGTFVADNPPHLSHYAMVFATHPVDRILWGNLWQLLANEAMSINRAGARKVTCYYDVDGHSDSEDFQKLLRDLRSRRLAGVIFAGANPVISHALLEELAVPRIAISSPIPETPVATIWPNLMGFLDRAVEHLAKSGRRAPALFLSSGKLSHYWERERFRLAIEKHGMRHKPKWVQFVDVFDREAPLRLVQSVMDRDQGDPPDSLIVADDTMLESVAAGLGMMDIHVPEHAEVVGHANFPWVVPTAVPVTRLGFDLRGIVRSCIESIDRQRQGQAEVGHIEVPPLFEHEIEQTPAPVGATRG